MNADDCNGRSYMSGNKSKNCKKYVFVLTELIWHKVYSCDTNKSIVVWFILLCACLCREWRLIDGEGLLWRHGGGYS